MLKNTSPIQVADHLISPIHINGMMGRKMTLPASDEKNLDREFIFFYGHHASIERIYSFAEYLSDFGTVTIYDVPGLGGMDSFYKIGEKPTLEMYADYMHTVFKAHNKTSHTTVVAMSLTVTMLIRMLQKYPQMHSYFDSVVSFVGFASYSNIKYHPHLIKIYRFVTRLLATRLLSWLVRVILFNPVSMRILLWFFTKFNTKLKSVSKKELKETLQMERDLWRRNDMRTHFATYHLMLSLSYPEAPKIPMKLINLTTENDQYFDGAAVEKDFKKLFETVQTDYLNLSVHVPSLVATKSDVGSIIPESVRSQELKR